LLPFPSTNRTARSPHRLGILSREELFEEIFGKTLLLFYEHLSAHLPTTYDAIGCTVPTELEESYQTHLLMIFLLVMLMVKMAHQFTNMMSKTRRLSIAVSDFLVQYFLPTTQALLTLSN